MALPLQVIFRDLYLPLFNKRAHGFKLSRGYTIAVLKFRFWKNTYIISFTSVLVKVMHFYNNQIKFALVNIL